MISHPRAQLTWELAKRELTERYAANALGAAWLVIQPLALVVIYLSVFTYIFQIRLPDALSVDRSFALFFVSGYACWFALSDCLSKSTGIISQHAAMVQQIVFPVEILPIKAALASTMSLVLFTLVVLVYNIVLDASFRPMLLMAPVLIVMMFALMTGLSYVFSVLGLFLKDVKDLVGLVLAGGIFLTPVFYPPNISQGPVRAIINANPLSYPIYCFQDVLFYGWFEHPTAWVVTAAMAVGLLVVGRYMFAKLEHAFGDAL